MAAYHDLLESGFLKDSDKVVLFNTGSGYKYLDTFADYWGVEASTHGPTAQVAKYRRHHRAVLETRRGGYLGCHRWKSLAGIPFRAIFDSCDYFAP